MNIDLKNNKILPVTVLSGFLGAGKTTLLEKILTNKNNLKVAIIVNDMNEINIDAELIKQGETSLKYKKEKMVELSNGCICCTLREDLLEEVTTLAKSEKYDYLVIESSGISEPLPVAETFTFKDSSGKSLSDIACLDTMVTVVDGFNFLKDYNMSTLGIEVASIDTLSDRNIGISKDDERSIINLLTDQIEFANVILLNKIDLLTKDEISKVRGLIYHINPTVKIYETIRSDVSINAVLNTKLFKFEEAERVPGWLKEIRGQHIPETLEYGISSFIYKQRVPFHPKRLYDLFFSPESNLTKLQKKVELGKEELNKEEKILVPLLSVVRSKGFCWIGSRTDLSGIWSQAGRLYKLSCGVPWFSAIPEELWPEGYKNKIKSTNWDSIYGDRIQQIVFIGIYLDEKKVTQAINTCLMTEDEIKSANIYNAIKIVSLEDLSKEELEMKIDKLGNEHLSQSNKYKHNLDDPFDKWIIN